MDWSSTERGRLALILLLDQFPRNVFRGTARAFATDATALDLALEGMRLKRPLEAGAALSAAHVEPKPAVARDEQVTVRVVSGTVTIETVGRALADARVGETIQVKSAGSTEPFSARVVGEGVVQVSTR